MAFKKSTAKNEREAHMMVVKRAFLFDNNNVSFDLEIDGWITIYNMTLVAKYSEKDTKKIKNSKNPDYSKFDPDSYFIAFPQHKDDKGNWWSYAYFKIIDAEQDVIEEQIQHILDEAEEKK